MLVFKKMLIAVVVMGLLILQLCGIWLSVYLSKILLKEASKESANVLDGTTIFWNSFYVQN